jgi:hypothetical protein
MREIMKEIIEEEITRLWNDERFTRDDLSSLATELQRWCDER